MDFVITLDPESTGPLHRRLGEALRRAILTGRLRPGQRLPSSRSLATLLQISRSTVTQTFEDLLSEGYLEAAHGSGTFVCQQLPEELQEAGPAGKGAAEAPDPPFRLSEYGARVAEPRPLTNVRSSASLRFSHGRPDLETFPAREWSRLVNRHLRSGGRSLFDYAEDPRGHPPLREAIARYLARSRAVVCTQDQVLIVGGSQQALNLIARLLVNPGDVVALEDPGYLGARHIFRTQGARLWPVPVDDAGLLVDRLSAADAPEARLVYVTPSHQFPSGATLSLPRRLELLAWARQRGAMVVEDDYDSEYRYGGRPVPALQGLDPGGNVLYVGTFSKVLFPALRVGYLVVPQALSEVFARARWLDDRHSPMLEQHVLTDFLEEGHLERHVRRMRTLYDRRRQTLVGELEAWFGDQVTVVGEAAGMHVLVRFRLENGLDDDTLILLAEQAGVGLTSARPYYLERGGVGSGSGVGGGGVGGGLSGGGMVGGDGVGGGGVGGGSGVGGGLSGGGMVGGSGGGAGELVFGYADLSEGAIRGGVRRLARVLLGPASV